MRADQFPGFGTWSAAVGVQWTAFSTHKWASILMLGDPRYHFHSDHGTMGESDASPFDEAKVSLFSPP